MENRYRKIIKLLQENKIITAEKMSELLSISEKTIRNDIKLLKSDVMRNGGVIKSVPRIGYSLEIANQEKFDQYLLDKEEVEISTDGGRINTIINYLLKHTNSYMKLEDLAEQMHLSISSMNRDFKYVKKEIEARNLKLESKHGSGIRIVGDEYDIRLLIAAYAVRRDNKESCFDEQKMKKVEYILLQVLEDSPIEMADYAFDNLLVHTMIMLQQVIAGKYAYFEPEKMIKLRSLQGYETADKLCTQLEQALQIVLPEAERGYIAIHFTAKENIKSAAATGNIEISEAITGFVEDFLDNILKDYRLDFHNDFDLVMALAMHFASLDIRMTYALNLKNPILDEIKQYYQMAYAITNNSIQNLAMQKYSRLLSEDEVAYVAMHINLAMERNRKSETKKNVLIVCSAGAGISQMLKYEYASRFGEYIDEIYCSDTKSLENFDFNKIDYVLSAVNNSIKCGKPVLLVHPIMERNDFAKVEMVLKQDSKIITFFPEYLFYDDLAGTTPEEIIVEMSERIRKSLEIPEDFEEKVLKREQFGVTSFKSGVAFPHPCEPCVDKTFVAVGILHKSVVWNGNKVQMVYLFALNKGKEEENISLLYQITGQLLTDNRRIKTIIDEKTYQCLVKNLVAIEQHIGE